MAMANVAVLRALLRLRKVLKYLGLANLALIKRMTHAVKRDQFSEIFDSSSECLSIKLNGLHISLPRRFLNHYIIEEYEPLTKKVFQQALRRGMVVVDVGAHLGYYSLLAAKAVGETGAVHAIEPCQENLEYLARNIALNGFKMVTIHPHAGGKIQRKRALHITESSDSHGFYSHPLANTIRTVEVSELPLDDVLNAPIHAVKVDVEGAEMEVLKGMERLLTQSRHPPLWVEWNPACMRRAGYQPLDLPAYLSDLGYSNILVLNDQQRQIISIDRAREFICSGEMPDYWYVNLWARRR